MNIRKAAGELACSNMLFSIPPEPRGWMRVTAFAMAQKYNSSEMYSFQSLLNHAFSIIMIRSTLIRSVVTQVSHLADSIIFRVSNQPP
jgi:hypothetical protein